MELAGDGESVCFIQPCGIGVQGTRRCKGGCPECSSVTFEFLAEDLQASVIVRVQGLGEVIDDP